MKENAPNAQKDGFSTLMESASQLMTCAKLLMKLELVQNVTKDTISKEPPVSEMRLLVLQTLVARPGIGIIKYA